METTSTSAKRWWLLSTRGVIYMVIGVTMFIFSANYSAQTASIIGVLALLAGVCGAIFAFSNDRADRNNIWGILHGITDIILGVAMFVFSQGTVQGFIDILGFWAVMYAFLQSVQAMYLYMASSGSNNMSSYYPFKATHFANVFVAGVLAYVLLIRPQGFDNTLGFIGIFPIILGGLILLLSIQYKSRSGR